MRVADYPAAVESDIQVGGGSRGLASVDRWPRLDRHGLAFPRCQLQRPQDAHLAMQQRVHLSSDGACCFCHPCAARHRQHVSCRRACARPAFSRSGGHRRAVVARFDRAPPGGSRNRVCCGGASAARRLVCKILSGILAQCDYFLAVGARLSILFVTAPLIALDLEISWYRNSPLSIRCKVLVRLKTRKLAWGGRFYEI